MESDDQTEILELWLKLDKGQLSEIEASRLAHLIVKAIELQRLPPVHGLN